MNLLAALLACLGALFGLNQFFRFRSRRDRQREIGETFTSVASGLGSKEQIERLSSAALLPRFFDAKSELGTKHIPYANDAVKLVAAVLKTESTSVVQKALADSLADAPSLAGVDFQRANLRGCYWGRRSGETPISAQRADFYRADLSTASLRGACLRKAQFKRAQLVGTVLKDADLRECNFDLANLRGASFDGALLAGASFVGANHIPSSIVDLLDKDGVFAGDSVAPSIQPTNGPLQSGRVFLSRPSQCDKLGLVMVGQICQGITAANMEIVTFPPDEYGIGAPLDEVKQRINKCDAVIILGVPQIEAVQATLRAGTDRERTIDRALLATPWNHIEAGIAAALDKPILIIRDEVNEGIFEIGDQPHAVTIIDVSGDESFAQLNSAVADWAAELPALTKVC
ncbi:MAG: pentapeptide repeat-containing protein [Coriobacteriia bacterium]|nr:pentapeptide repeat-containing protein [Coriobacteriia bacterium]